MFASRVLRFRACGPILAGKIKPTTGLAGLEVMPDFKEKLIEIYNRTLEEVTELPKNTPYRNSVTKITRYRLGVVKKFDDYEDVEREIDCGQVEELYEQAKDELILMDLLKNVEHRPEGVSPPNKGTPTVMPPAHHSD